MHNSLKGGFFMKKILSLLLIFLVLLSSCASNSNSSPSGDPNFAPTPSPMPPYTDSETEQPGYYPEEPSVPVDPDYPRNDTGIIDPTKVVKNGYFNLETRAFDQDLTLLKSLVSDMNGLVERSSISNQNSYSSAEMLRVLSMTLRIPSKDFENFQAQLTEKFTVTKEETSSKSVADQYFDSENRIEVLEVQQKRLLELLEKAENLSDVVLLQDQLMEVEYSLNQHKGTLKKLDDQIDYSTVSLNMTELDNTETSVVENNFFDDLGRAFNRGINSVVISFQNLFITLAENIIPIIILLGGAFILYRVAKRKNTKITIEPEPTTKPKDQE